LVWFYLVYKVIIKVIIILYLNTIQITTIFPNYIRVNFGNLGNQRAIMNILGIRIDNLSKTESLMKIEQFLYSDKQNILTTPNPEFLVAAGKDEEFKNILNKADLSLADGFGLVLAAKRQGEPLKERVAGSDLIWDIARLANEKNKSIFLLGGKDNVAELTAEKLKQKFPGLKIHGFGGGELSPEKENKEEIAEINKFAPDILFVAMNFVKQEKWIYKNLEKMPSVKLAAGLGGTFDFISGKAKRAPKFMRHIGLEWLWRLILEPWRWKRIYNAVFKFSWLVFIRPRA